MPSFTLNEACGQYTTPLPGGVGDAACASEDEIEVTELHGASDYGWGRRALGFLVPPSFLRSGDLAGLGVRAAVLDTY